MSKSSHAVLLALLALVGSSFGSIPELNTESVKIGVYDGDALPFYQRSCMNETGFEVALRKAVCDLAKLDCEVVYLPTLDDRLTGLENGTVDAVIGLFSVTPEREQKVEFVRPLYYSSGVALYAPDENHVFLSETGGWEGLEGRSLCFLAGYFANTGVEKNYAPKIVLVADEQDAVKKVMDGECEAVAYDSPNGAFQGTGLTEVAEVGQVLTTPYGIAVAKGNEPLAGRLSRALVQVMQDGSDSPILKWQDDEILARGFSSSIELADVVKAISYFRTSS